MKLPFTRAHATSRPTSTIARTPESAEGRIPESADGRTRLVCLRRGIRPATIAGVAIAVAVAPAALAWGGPKAHHSRAAANKQAPLRGGIHNPPFGAFSRSTGLTANDGGWATRIKNLGPKAGAAKLICKAAASGNPCLVSNNTSTGLAFHFKTAGSTGGTIQVGNANGAPFTTNAHGVATGLNANYLQGKQASDFQLASKPAADAEKLGGQPASSYATTGQLLFAVVSPEQKVVSTRGATAVAKSGSTYTVTFGKADLTKCSYTASPVGAALTSGQLGVSPEPNQKAGVLVTAPSGFEGGFDLQVIC